MTCRDDAVALSATKFLTSLPQKLSPTLTKSGELMELRRSVLNSCMDEIKRICDGDKLEPLVVCAENKSLKRALMLLNELLDESVADIRGRVKPHGGKWKSQTVAIRVQYSQGSVNSLLMVETSDTIQQLMGKIAKLCNKPASSLKMFRKGAELVLGRTRQTLQQIDITAGETVLVANKPNQVPTKVPDVLPVISENEEASSNSELASSHKPFSADVIANVSPAQSASSHLIVPEDDYICPLEALPLVMLSGTPEYLDILFTLIDMSSDSICDVIWNLISRLPTSPAVEQHWSEMVNKDFAEHVSVFELRTSLPTSNTYDAENLDRQRLRSLRKSFPKMLYNLQVIESMLNNSLQSSDSYFVASEDSPIKNREEFQILWAHNFVANNGMQIILDAFEYASEQAELFSRCNIADLRGLTPNLLLTTLSLSSKMLRGVLVRGQHASGVEAKAWCRKVRVWTQKCSKEFSVDSVASTIAVAVAAAVASSQTGSATDSNSSIASTGTVSTVSENMTNSASVAVAVSEEESNESKADDGEVDSLLLEEWGNVITESMFASRYSVTRSALLSENDSSRLQNSILRYISISRVFSMTGLFHIEAGSSASSVSIRQAVKSRQSILFESLTNTLYIWHCALKMNPHSILSFGSNLLQKSAIEDSIHGVMKQTLTGYIQMDLKHDDYVKLTFVSRKIANWFVEAMYSVMQELLDSLHESSSTLAQFGSSLLRTLLGLRPSISLASPTEELDRQILPYTFLPHIDVKLSFDASPLYMLASMLIEFFKTRNVPIFGAYSFFPFAEIMNVCNDVLQELIMANQNILEQNLICSGRLLTSSNRYRNIAGSLKLLSTLLSVLDGDGALKSFLTSNRVINLILESCLGISRLEDLRSATLCMEEDEM